MTTGDEELAKLIREHGAAWDCTRERGRLVAVSRDEEGVRLEAPSAAVMEMHIQNAEFPTLPRAGGASGG